MNHIELRQVFIEALKRIGQSPQMVTLLNEMFSVGLDRDLITSDDLRGSNIEQLKRDSRRGAPSIFVNAYWPEISALFWSFVTKGLISIGRSADQCELPFFQITRFGQEILHSDKISILDPSGITSNLKRTCPQLDPIVEEYLAEAAACYDVSCYKATLVMLGCAAEKTILNLIEAFISSPKDGSSKERLIKSIEKKQISTKFEEFSKRYVGISGEVDEHIGRHDIKIELHTMFHLIRYYRNKSGHPSGIAFEKEVVTSALLIFPELYKICENLTFYFQEKK